MPRLSDCIIARNPADFQGSLAWISAVAGAVEQRFEKPHTIYFPHDFPHQLPSMTKTCRGTFALT